MEITDGEIDALTTAIRRVATEIRVLRDMLDEVRASIFSALHGFVPDGRGPSSRIIKRMAADPTARDWASRLVCVTSSRPVEPEERLQPAERQALNERCARLIDDLGAELAYIATEHFERTLVALDGLRHELPTVTSGGDPVPKPDRAADTVIPRNVLLAGLISGENTSHAGQDGRFPGCGGDSQSPPFQQNPTHQPTFWPEDE